MIEAVGFFIAAVRAVAPRPDGGLAIRSGEELLEWIASGRAVRSVLDDLTERERADLRFVLDGMVRERAQAG